MNDIPPPESWSGRTISKIDILMFIRQQMFEGVPPEVFFRKLDAQLVVAFECGIEEAIRHNRLVANDVRDNWFFEWLRDFKKEFPGGGWHQKLLNELNGDHLAAIRRYLDFVAEFVSLRDTQQLPAPPYYEPIRSHTVELEDYKNPFEPPASWKDRHVSTLDILLFVRDRTMNAGIMLEMFFGRADLYSLAAFVEGIELTLHYNRLPDPGFREFIASLEDFKGEPLQVDWPEQYLKEADGDHRVAIHHFLDLAAEFVVQRSRAPSPVPPRR